MARWTADSPLTARNFAGFKQVGLVNHLSVPRNLTPRMSDAMLDRAVIPVLRRMVEDIAARVIHAHTESLAPAAVAVGQVTGAKVVVTLHGINVGRDTLVLRRGGSAFGARWRQLTESLS
jgi:hypothetical protein